MLDCDGGGESDVSFFMLLPTLVGSLFFLVCNYGFRTIFPTCSFDVMGLGPLPPSLMTEIATFYSVSWDSLRYFICLRFSTIRLVDSYSRLQMVLP